MVIFASKISAQDNLFPMIRIDTALQKNKYSHIIFEVRLNQNIDSNRVDNLLDIHMYKIQ